MSSTLIVVLKENNLCTWLCHGRQGCCDYCCNDYFQDNCDILQGIPFPIMIQIKNKNATISGHFIFLEKFCIHIPFLGPHPLHVVTYTVI